MTFLSVPQSNVIYFAFDDNNNIEIIVLSCTSGYKGQLVRNRATIQEKTTETIRKIKKQQHGKPVSKHVAIGYFWKLERQQVFANECGSLVVNPFSLNRNAVKDDCMSNANVSLRLGGVWLLNSCNKT